jgi:hypothetical protein
MEHMETIVKQHLTGQTENLHTEMTEEYRQQKEKLKGHYKRCKHKNWQQTTLPFTRHTPTSIQFKETETLLLRKRLDYSLHYKPNKNCARRNGNSHKLHEKKQNITT